MEQAGWLGVSLQTRAPPPLPSHRGRAGAGSAGSLASPPCGPGCEDGGDLGVLSDRQTTGRVLSGAGASCHAAFTAASPQEGEQPLLESLASSHPSPSVFLRDSPFQWLASGSASSSAHCGRSPWESSWTVSPGPGDASGRMPAPAAQDSDPQRQVLFLNWRNGAGFCRTSAWIRPYVSQALPPHPSPRLCRAL